MPLLEDINEGPLQPVLENVDSVWREETDTPPRVFRAVALWQKMAKDTEIIGAAIKAGKLNTPISGKHRVLEMTHSTPYRSRADKASLQATTWAFVITA